LSISAVNGGDKMVSQIIAAGDQVGNSDGRHAIGKRHCAGEDIRYGREAAIRHVLKAMAPEGAGPEALRLVTTAVKVTGWPAPTVRKSGADEKNGYGEFVVSPDREQLAAVSGYISSLPGRSPVGTYGSPTPEPRFNVSVREFDARFPTRDASILARGKDASGGGVDDRSVDAPFRTAYG